MWNWRVGRIPAMIVWLDTGCAQCRGVGSVGARTPPPLPCRGNGGRVPGCVAEPRTASVQSRCPRVATLRRGHRRADMYGCGYAVSVSAFKGDLDLASCAPARTRRAYCHARSVAVVVCLSGAVVGSVFAAMPCESTCRLSWCSAPGGEHCPNTLRRWLRMALRGRCAGSLFARKDGGGGACIGRSGLTARRRRVDGVQLPEVRLGRDVRAWPARA